MSKEGGKRQWTASILKATLQTPDIIPDNNVAINTIFDDENPQDNGGNRENQIQLAGSGV